MADPSLRQFLVQNKFDPAAGVRRLLPSAANGSLRYLLANFVFYANGLQTYQQLNINDQLVSNNGHLNLLMQRDGNLVLYRTMFGQALWSSNTVGQQVTHTIMQADGNLVAYTASGTADWATGTQGHPGAYAMLQDDGNFVVYDAANNALWASNTLPDFNSPTFQYTDASGYNYDETSENWKQVCTAFPCFALLQWPGYATQVIDSMGGQPLMINGQPVVIQLWKGTCQKFLGGLGNFPGGHRCGGWSVPPGAGTGPANFAVAIFSSRAVRCVHCRHYRNSDRRPIVVGFPRARRQNRLHAYQPCHQPDILRGWA